MTSLLLTTLGVTEARADGEVVPLQPLPLVLLAYLAMEGIKPRRHLAELLWPDSSNGLNSLSSALSRIRSKVPDVIVSHGTSAVSVDLRLDVQEILDHPPHAAIDPLLALYNGPFLSTIPVERFGTEVEDWVYRTREATVARLESVVLEAAVDSLKNGHGTDAADLAERAWGIATRDSVPNVEQLGTYHRCLAAGSRPLAADVRREAEDYGVELDAGTVSIAETVAAVNIPSDSPSGFGYTKERATLQATVPLTPITQIVGLGGSGKTFLADSYMEGEYAARAFDQRVCVDLSATTDSTLVAAAIALEFGVQPAPGQALSDVLPDLGSTLLLLHNFEQVVDACDVVADLAATHRCLRIVVTSRVPLAMEGSTIHLRGLDSMDPTASGFAPAQQLFLASAERAGARLAEIDRDVLQEICVLVHGLPLALELAGAWARLLAPAEIARSLRQSLELLEPSRRDLAQRSMRLIIEQSVADLDDRSRGALAQLALFPAGCSVQAATADFSISMQTLADLADRSLLTIDPAGSRIGLHPLIVQGIRETLLADREHELRHRQMSWCASLVETASFGPSSATGLIEAIGPDLRNILALWNWGASSGSWAAVDTSLWPVREYLVASGRLVEGRQSVDELLAAASHTPPPADLHARLKECGAWLALLTGSPGRARGLIAEADQLSNAGGSADTRVLVLRTLGTIDLGGGDHESAAASFSKALELVTPSTPTALVAKLQDDMGICLEAQGRTDEAEAAFRSTLALGRDLGEPSLIARAHLLLAGLEQVRNPRRSLVLVAEGLAVAQDNGLDQLAIYFPLFAGHAHLALGSSGPAAKAFEDAGVAATDAGHRISVAAANLGMAEANLPSDVTRAEAYLIEGIRVAVETRSLPYLTWAAYLAADLTMGVDASSESARALLALSLHHPNSLPLIHARAAVAAERYGMDPAVEPDDDLLAVEIDRLGELLLELLLFD